MIKANDWNVSETDLTSAFQSTVAGKDRIIAIHDHGVEKAKLADACRDLVDLLFRMRPRISWIGSNRTNRNPFDPERF